MGYSQKREEKGDSPPSYHLILSINISYLSCQVKKEAQQQRKKEAEALGDKAPPKQVPRTIENTREYDATTVDVDDEEVQFDITHDEYESYFSKTYEPKILITSSDNPHTVSIIILNFLLIYSSYIILSFSIPENYPLHQRIDKDFPQF